MQRDEKNTGNSAQGQRLGGRVSGERKRETPCRMCPMAAVCLPIGKEKLALTLDFRVDKDPTECGAVRERRVLLYELRRKYEEEIKNRHR